MYWHQLMIKRFIDRSLSLPRLQTLSFETAIVSIVMVFNFRDVDRHPIMAKLKEAAGEHWSLQVANPPGALKMLSPTSTGTEESGTAAPKTPTCDMEIAYSRPCPDQYEYSAHQGSTGFPDSSRLFPELASAEIRNGEASGTSHGRKRLKRIPPACIAPPLMRSEPLEQTPTSCFRDNSTQTRILDLQAHQDEDTEAVVQAATSLLSLASNEQMTSSICRSSSDEGIRSSSPEPEGSGRESCSSVLCRPSNKRRYRLMVDLLVECPRVVP